MDSLQFSPHMPVEVFACTVGQKPSKVGQVVGGCQGSGSDGCNASGLGSRLATPGMAGGWVGGGACIGQASGFLAWFG